MWFEQYSTREELFAHLKPAPLLCEALTLWVDTLDYSAQTSACLHSLWAHLARVLCDRDNRRMQPFLDEIGGTDYDGHPPVQSITARIAELRDAGLAPYFLIIAVRHALDVAIPGYPLLDSESWQRIADERLPATLIGSVPPDEEHIWPVNFSMTGEGR